MFYEMLSKFGFDALSELPEDIVHVLDEKKVSELIGREHNDAKPILDFMWEKVKEISKRYIDAKWTGYFDINKDKLLEDIKLHCIFTIYLSILSQDLKEKSIIECEEVYFEYIAKSKNADKIENTFRKRLAIFLQDIADDKYSEGFTNSDFDYYINNGIKIKDYENCLVNIDPLIFSHVVSNWSKCPYNFNNSDGMTFKKLYDFYEDFQKLITKSHSLLEKSIRSFIIERLFNVSFLLKLINCVNSNDINIQSEDIKKPKLIVIDENGAKNLGSLVGGQEMYDKCHVAAANRLLNLSEIVSIPMVFHRNNYIDIINNSFESNAKDENYLIKFRCGLFYLNSYLIPLLLRLYYVIMFYRFSAREDSNRCIKDLLEKFIKDNSDEYKCENTYISDNKMFKENFFKEALQVNATNVIYNCKYNRNKFEVNKDYKNNLEKLLQVDMRRKKLEARVRIRKNDKKVYDIFENMRMIENEIYHEELYNLNNKYSYNYYKHNFPYNILYSNYKNNKK